MPATRFTFRTVRLQCQDCGAQTKELRWLHEADRWTCRTCGGHQVAQDLEPGRAPTVIGDECDIIVSHGICHADGTPKRYTSKSAMRQEARALGLVNAVEHVPPPGGDRSPHTTRWI